MPLKGFFLLQGKSKLEFFCLFNMTKSIQFQIALKNKSDLGEDTLKLFFKITKNADLSVKCFDIKDEFFGEYNLGNIF